MLKEIHILQGVEEEDEALLTGFRRSDAGARPGHCRRRLLRPLSYCSGMSLASALDAMQTVLLKASEGASKWKSRNQIFAIGKYLIAWQLKPQQQRKELLRQSGEGETYP